ncbi:MAG: sugar ABC transporter ATP-binding protein [Albidovulum sp.]|nr:sugar ABC transporter ATP-binding protein [Albidovulum sp.]
MSDERIPLLEASNVTKIFGAVRALTSASLELFSGEIVALLGANGAGKSTLVNVLTGAIRPDSGHVRIRGREFKAASPTDARQSGLIPVYQESSMIPDLSVADNLRLTNTEPAPFRYWLGELGIGQLGLDEEAGGLPLATLRILDLARALASEPEVLLLDEMTAALPTDLVRKVLDVIRSQKARDCGIIFISHRFVEVAAVCDRASVLRDGRTVGDLAIEPGVEDRIVDMMLGGSIDAAAARKAKSADDRAPGLPRLSAKGLSAGTNLADVSFELHRGEVLGVVALEGQGQDELFEVLSGFEKPSGGFIEVEGNKVSFEHPADAIEAGLAYVPGDRAAALLMQRSVRENIALPFSAQVSAWGAIPVKREGERVAEAIERLQIDTRAQGEVRRLSGGNQQKVTIGRWIATGTKTLLLFDPTRGIDIRTKRQIYPLMREFAKQGASVLYYSSELEEIPLVCDRVIVIFSGRIVDTFNAGDADESTLMRAAHGLALSSAEAA